MQQQQHRHLQQQQQQQHQHNANPTTLLLFLQALLGSLQWAARAGALSCLMQPQERSRPA
jgi:hypothetical protein